MKDRDDRIIELENKVRRLEAQSRNKFKMQDCPKCGKETLQMTNDIGRYGIPVFRYLCTICGSLLRCTKVTQCTIAEEVK